MFEVYHDAAHIKALSKSDMIKFFDHYISASSPARSKIVLNLHAQQTLEASEPSAITGILNERFNELGVESQPAALQRRLTAAGSGQAGVREAVKAHLVFDLKMAAERAKHILEEGMKALHLKRPKTPEVSQKEVEVEKPPVVSKPYVIDDVREFRSMLAVSPGPRPVKDLSEFEGLDSKL